MKKVLFLHPNFPAQFKHLCENLNGNELEIKFLCQTHHGREIKGINKLVIKKKVCDDDGKIKTKSLNSINQAQIALRYKDAFKSLKSEGWQPDYVISHSGWGCGMYVKAIWPKCKLISYAEWWFDPQSDFYTYDDKNNDLCMNSSAAIDLWSRNQQLSLELVTADTIISPTKWQRKQFPEMIRSKTVCIFDGINMEKFRSKNFKRSLTPLITYGTRGMEPVRAFKQFIREIPDILKIEPNIRVEIAGYDEVHYGGRLPKGYKSWGMWAKSFLKKEKVDERVKWIGYLKEDEYCQWLKSSWCHIYLTHPFVLSWSFIEAYVAGCPIVCSNVEPVLEFAKEYCVLIDHRKKGSISKGVNIVVKDPLRWAKADLREVSEMSKEKAFSKFLNVTGLELTTIG